MEQDPNKPCPECAMETLARLRRVVSRAPWDPELRLTLARALLDNTLADEAIHEIRLAIEMSPNHLEARKLLEQAQRASAPRPS